MATSRIKRALVAGGAALAFGAAALAQQQQQQRPESLLPPGFGDPAPAPAPAPTAARPAAAPTAGATGAFIQPLPGVAATPLPEPSPSVSPTAVATPRYVMPASARRSLALVGAADSFRRDAFGTADGRYLEIVMRRLSAPLPSRWLSIALRRMLVARVDTPRGLNGADFAAERAWLLLRMGESVGARAVVQAVDTDRVTPKLRQVWMQAALANGDPGGLCPLAPTAGNAERGWVVARAMCAGLTGDTRARALIADARRQRVASGIDLQLAQKVMGAGVDSRQAITVDWTPVVQLTAWRFGLAVATGATVPDELYATVGAQVTGWRALAPGIPLIQRAAAADRAAAMGVVSSAALVDLYSALADADDVPGALTRTTNGLRDAYVAADDGARLSALGALWDGASDDAGRYARLILTAHAAARVTPRAGVDQADRLVAAMLSAGMDRTALRWQPYVRVGGDAWAMLLLADPDARGIRPGSIIGDYTPEGATAQRRKQMFFAALAGLGRLSAADVEENAATLDVRIGSPNGWTRAIDRAAAEGQAGTVLLLAATGMQAGNWRAVPPAALYRALRSLRAVGLDGEARMIAAEAIARLA
nr:hypothetical protein [uncultured Sphingomonas sp.]